MFLEKILPNYHLDPQGYVAPIQARAVFRAGGVCGRAGVRFLHLTMMIMMMMMRMMWRRRRMMVVMVDGVADFPTVFF